MNTYSAGVGIHASGKDDLPGVPDTPWLIRTKWRLHFQTRDLAAIADQTKHPGRQDENDIDIILSIIVHATRSYFEHALKIAVNSSHPLLRWARSISSTNPAPAPFRFVQNHSSFQRYVRYWSRMLCFLCRSTFPYSSTHQFLHLNSIQSQHLQTVIIQAEHCVEDVPDAHSNLQTAIHHLFLSLIQQYIPESPFDSPLLNFLACLGIDPRTSTFRHPTTYTPILAAFVYCIRIIMIFESYLQADKHHTPDRLELFKRHHAKWLTSGSEYPLGEIVNLMSYGISCSKDIQDATIFWRRDRESLFYCGQQIEILNLGFMAKDLGNLAYSIGLEYFGWDSADIEDLHLHDLQDELGNRELGYSFLNDRRNDNLLNPERVLRRFLTTSDESDQPSGLFSKSRSPLTNKPYRIVVQAELEKLLQANEVFLELLLVLTHITCGQPPRGTEILSVLVSNSETHRRHVFIIDGQLVLITNYNKNQSVTGRENFILRGLPDCISKLWVAYLAYTKPVLAYAEKIFHHQCTLSSDKSTSAYAFHTKPLYQGITPPNTAKLLFHSRQARWKSKRLTDLLQYYGSDYLSFHDLGISIYRHIAISIFRNRMTHVKLIDPRQPHQIPTPIPTRQAGHSTLTSRRYYAPEVSHFNSLDRETLELFQDASRAWHKHFDLNTHRLSQQDFPSAMYSRLNPPLGSKVPLRLYQHDRQAGLPSISLDSSSIPLPDTRLATSSRNAIDGISLPVYPEVHIRQPNHFERESYKTFPTEDTIYMVFALFSIL